MKIKKSSEHLHNIHRDRWMVSYADFVTLLFAFFVTFYSISSVDPAKYAKLSTSMQEVFHSETDALEPSGNAKKGIEQSAAQGLAKEKIPNGWESVYFELLGRRIDITFDELVKQGLVIIKKDPSFIEISINSAFLFGTGETQLKEDARKIVSKLAAIFLQNPGSSIYVEGFTDNAPIHTVNYPSNWELSAARSAAVVRLLADEGVDPSLMAAVGYAEYQPVAENKTEKGRSKNRRVIILISRYAYHKNDKNTLQTMRSPYLEHKSRQRENKSME